MKRKKDSIGGGGDRGARDRRQGNGDVTWEEIVELSRDLGLGFGGVEAELFAGSPLTTEWNGRERRGPEREVV